MITAPVISAHVYRVSAGTQLHTRMFTYLRRHLRQLIWLCVQPTQGLKVAQVVVLRQGVGEVDDLHMRIERGKRVMVHANGRAEST